MMDRRRFLLSSVALPLGLVGAAASARAFSIEEPAVSLTHEYQAAKAAACGGSQAYHQKVLADLRALLNGENVQDAAAQQRLAQATCPLCGCSLVES